MKEVECMNERWNPALRNEGREELLEKTEKEAEEKKIMRRECAE